MTRPLWFAALPSLLFLTSGTAGQDKPPEPKEGAVYVHYSGTVTEVTKTSVTIEWPGEKPKLFQASETLAAGEFPKAISFKPNGRLRTTLPLFRYRLADVKVGDRVQIYFSRLNGVDICDAISISKRPGGQVPPLPDGAEPLLESVSGKYMPRYHEWTNALWDLEDKGIPFPEKFGEFRRWPVAPMPRDVTVSGPRISP